MKIFGANYSFQLPAITDKRKEARADRREYEFARGVTTKDYVFLKKKTRVQMAVEAEVSRVQTPVPQAGSPRRSAVSVRAQSVRTIRDSLSREGNNSTTSRAEQNDAFIPSPEGEAGVTGVRNNSGMSARPTPAQEYLDQWRRQQMPQGSEMPVASGSANPAPQYVDEDTSTIYSRLPAEDLMNWARTSLSTAWKNWVLSNKAQSTDSARNDDDFYGINQAFNTYLNNESAEPPDITRPFLDSLNEAALEAVDAHRAAAVERRLMNMLDSFPANVKKLWTDWIHGNRQGGMDIVDRFEHLQNVGEELKKYLNNEINNLSPQLVPFVSSVKDERKEIEAARNTNMLAQAPLISGMLDWTDANRPVTEHVETARLSTAWRNWINARTHANSANVQQYRELKMLGSALEQYLRGRSAELPSTLNPFLETLTESQRSEVTRISNMNRGRDEIRSENGSSVRTERPRAAASSPRPSSAGLVAAGASTGPFEQIPLSERLDRWVEAGAAGENRAQARQLIDDWVTANVGPGAIGSVNASLDLSNMGLTEMPPLPDVRYLNLDGNQLTTLPPLTALPTNLARIWLRNNPTLANIPRTYFESPRETPLVINLGKKEYATFQEQIQSLTSENIQFREVELASTSR